MVVVALLVLTACDPTGNTNVGGATLYDSSLFGAWLNIQVIPSGEDGNYLRLETKWVFREDASCVRESKAFDLAEGMERTTTLYCTWVADGQTLWLTYSGHTDQVTFNYSFPTQYPDTLYIGDFRFARVP